MIQKELNISITKKVFLYLFIACILPTLILGITAVNKTNEVLRYEINEFSNDVLVNKQQNIELVMQNIESLILNVSGLDDVRSILKAENSSSYEKLAAQAKVGYILSGYSNLKGLVSIDIFSTAGSHYHVGDTLDFHDTRKDLEARLFSEAVQSDKMVVWNGIEDNINVNSAHRKVITASKAIKFVDSNTMTEKPLGFVVVNYDVNAFTEKINGRSMVEAHYFIIDNKKRILFSSRHDEAGNPVSLPFFHQLTEMSGSFLYTIDGDKTMVNYTRSPKSGWIMIGMIPLKTMNAKLSLINKNLMIFTGFFFCMLLAFGFIVSKKYLTPIKRITELFQQLQSGSVNLDTRLPVVSNDEVGELVTWFNSFLYSLKEKKAVEENLLKSKEKYTSVVNNVKEVIFQTDADGNWIFLNPAWTELTGFSVDESLDTPFLQYIHPDDRARNIALFKPMIEGKKDHCRHTIRYVSKDGEIRWTEVYARLTLDNHSNIIGTSGTLMDVTENKHMEQELLDRERLLESIADATYVLLETPEYANAFTIALQILGTKANADRVYIFENHTDPDTGILLTSQRFQWCRDLKFRCEELPTLSYSHAGLMRWHELLSSGKIVTGQVKDFPASEQSLLHARGIISILIVPIFFDGKLWGFVGFDDCSTGHAWSRIEEDILKIAAVSIGGAIKRMRAEEELQKELRNDFKNTVQNLQNLVFRIRHNVKGEQIFTLFEGKIASELNLDTEKVLGKTPKEFFGHKTFDIIREPINKAFEGEVVSFEVPTKGRYFYCVLSPVIEEGIVSEVVGSCVDITEQKKAEDKIRYLAYYDTLTSIPNRVLFNESLNSAILQAQKDGSMVAVMFLDLDQFKLINDTLGHITGDILLKEVAARLMGCLRESDTLSRMGGDEFTIMFRNLLHKDEISALAGNVLEVFRQPFLINNHEFFLTTSVGVTVYPQDGEDIATLLKNADMAMYRAKEQGRNNYQFYVPSMNDNAMERLSMESNLRKAIDLDEFFLCYQPQVDIKADILTGCEALIRWHHPTLGMIPPADFIPLAEETGLIVAIGELVLRKACKQAKTWHDQGYSHLSISVNISARQFQEANIVTIVEDILQETGLEPHLLELEITENSIMQNTNRTLAIIEELKSFGIRISIDDFGTGFSSLSYLKRFSVDKLKVDKSFIADITTSPSDAAITASIINMAHSLNLSVIAEGVETKEQLELLRLYNCNEAQGYLFSKPLDVKAFEQYLAAYCVSVADRVIEA